MWMVTKHGFYSIVQDRNNRAQWMVRARVADDLWRLLALTGLDVTVWETKNADYRFRIVVEATQLAVVMCAIGNGIDYPNFKSNVLADPEMKERYCIYSDAYHKLERLRSIEATGKDPEGWNSPSRTFHGAPATDFASSRARQDMDDRDFLAGRGRYYLPPERRSGSSGSGGAAAAGMATDEGEPAADEDALQGSTGYFGYEPDDADADTPPDDEAEEEDTETYPDPAGYKPEGWSDEDWERWCSAFEKAGKTGVV